MQRQVNVKQHWQGPAFKVWQVTATKEPDMTAMKTVVFSNHDNKLESSLYSFPTLQRSAGLFMLPAWSVSGEAAVGKLVAAYTVECRVGVVSGNLLSRSNPYFK